MNIYNKNSLLLRILQHCYKYDMNNSTHDYFESHCEKLTFSGGSNTPIFNMALISLDTETLMNFSSIKPSCTASYNWPNSEPVCIIESINCIILSL